MSKHEICKFLNESIKDEKDADSKYKKVSQLMAIDYPDYQKVIEEIRKDEKEHHKIFNELKTQFKCK